MLFSVDRVFVQTVSCEVDALFLPVLRSVGRFAVDNASARCGVHFVQEALRSRCVLASRMRSFDRSVRQDFPRLRRECARGRWCLRNFDAGALSFRAVSFSMLCVAGSGGAAKRCWCSMRRPMLPANIEGDRA